MGNVGVCLGGRRLQRAVFLDRDGVVNRAEVRGGRPYAPRRLEDFRLLRGVAGAVAALREAWFRIVVVTNQPDIASGLVDPAVVEAMHAQLRARLPIDAIEMCAHGQDEGCACRKPRPGLLLAAARRFFVDLRRSFVIGDRWHDIVAGREAGCYTVFIDRGYRERRPVGADAVVGSLPAAVRRIMMLVAVERVGKGET